MPVASRGNFISVPSKGNLTIFKETVRFTFDVLNKEEKNNKKKLFTPSKIKTYVRMKRSD